jgi:hypothetical protein
MAGPSLATGKVCSGTNLRGISVVFPKNQCGDMAVIVSDREGASLVFVSFQLLRLGPGGLWVFFTIVVSKFLFTLDLVIPLHAIQ